MEDHMKVGFIGLGRMGLPMRAICGAPVMNLASSIARAIEPTRSLRKACASLLVQPKRRVTRKRSSECLRMMRLWNKSSSAKMGYCRRYGLERCMFR